MRFPKYETPELLLRLALALSFLYPAINALFDPYSWIGYFPAFLNDLASPHQLLLLHSFGFLEVVLATWVLVGKRVRIPALIMTLMLVAIVAVNSAQFVVLFRDLAIALAALALAFYPARTSSEA